MMDEAPSKLGEHELEDLPERLCAAAEKLDWVEKASVRLREHGRVIVGEVFVVAADVPDLVMRIEQAAVDLRAMDWRLDALTVMPVRQL